MPGIIQVSVLEFMALQSSSPLSQMSIKVSMGKREYQTFDKGEFSFPLTTLRDNLIVTLEDSNGKKISHTVVETRLVIEKGIWDNIFPFEEGGHVHMKLQFVLSEDDRHRIRMMRESALRKKRNELIRSAPTSPAGATTVGINVAQLLQRDHESLDSNNSHVRGEVVQDGLNSTVISPLFKKGKPGPQDKDLTHSVQKQTNPNDTDRLEGTASITAASNRFNVHKRLNGTVLGSSGSAISAMNQAPVELHSDKQSPPEETQSKIRNMISAFESSLNQDMKPKIRPAAPLKSQSRGTGVEVASKSAHQNEVKTENDELAKVSGRIRSPSPIHSSNMQKAAANIRKRGEQIGSVSQPEQLTERASVSGRMHKAKGANPLSNLFFWRRNTNENSLNQKDGKGIQPRTLQQVNIQCSSEDEPQSLEPTGAWIYPDGGKRLCITSGGKRIMNLTGNLHTHAKRQQGRTGSNMMGYVKEAKEGNQDARRHTVSTNTNGSTDAESSRGPVGQVMKVAIMVGFATLVFFTRQSKQGS